MGASQVGLDSCNLRLIKYLLIQIVDKFFILIDVTRERRHIIDLITSKYIYIYIYIYMHANLKV